MLITWSSDNPSFRYDLARLRCRAVFDIATNTGAHPLPPTRNEKSRPWSPSVPASGFARPARKTAQEIETKTVAKALTQTAVFYVTAWRACLSISGAPARSLSPNRHHSAISSPV
ncbi:MAG: hypothetical protein MI923_16390 [Phycisphaerales bacterium]|nr:hypothetical protein [Phycisphaerales bacterium]